MIDFDMGLATRIALGGLGVVFLILIILSFAIGAVKMLSDRIDRWEKGKQQ